MEFRYVVIADRVRVPGDLPDVGPEGLGLLKAVADGAPYVRGAASVESDTGDLSSTFCDGWNLPAAQSSSINSDEPALSKRSGGNQTKVRPEPPTYLL